MQQLWSKKEIKFKKIEEKLRKDIKEKTKKLHQQELVREQKRQLIVDKLTEKQEEATEEYHRYLEELRTKEVEKVKRLR